MQNKKDPLHQFDLSRLKNATQDEVIKDKSLSEGLRPMKGATEKINTKEVQPILKGSDFVEKIAAKRAALQAGKKLMGAVPLLGAGYAALQGDPAMAAEELASDAVPVYDAIKPEIAGNPEEERLMLAERKAIQNYQNSPAALARANALKNIK